jgi:exodeoxyribonuclease VII large subunit
MPAAENLINAPEFTVSELSSALKRTVEDRFGHVRVRGEISGFRGPHSSGHCYFALKDEGAKIEAVVWKGVHGRMRFKPQEGLEVIATGKLTTYPGSSKYQIVIEAIEPAGVGALMALLEERKKKLAAEGLFAAERKRDLPLLPRRIGLVTGNDAAAKRDVITTIQSRFPGANVLVAETYVQGPRAAQGVIDALDELCAQPGVDVIVLARGGGSFEDLLPFSDERLVRAVAACRVPIVSAVGHEQDSPLCDFAADVRASTPTMAGKLVVPELSQLSGKLDRSRAALALCVRRTLERDAQTLERSAERLRAAPHLMLERHGQRIERAHERLRQAPTLAVERKRAALETTAGKLRVLSPLKTLERGYAIVRTDSKLVTASADVSPGARVDVRLASGAFGARVEDIEE